MAYLKDIDVECARDICKERARVELVLEKPGGAQVSGGKFCRPCGKEALRAVEKEEPKKEGV